MAAACGSWPAIPPSRPLAVWVGAPSKGPPIQTPERRSQAITPVIDGAAHHSEGCTREGTVRPCQGFVARSDDQAADWCDNKSISRGFSG